MGSRTVRDRGWSTTGTPCFGLRDHLRLEVSCYCVKSVQYGMNWKNRFANDVDVNFSGLYCVRGLIK